MSQIELERFLGRLILDADFRARAAYSLIKVCCDEGMALSAEEMLLLSRVDFSQFSQIAETLNGSIRRK